MLICCSRNISDYYQCWKEINFLWKSWYILFFWIFDEQKVHKNSIYLKQKSFVTLCLYCHFWSTECILTEYSLSINFFKKNLNFWVAWQETITCAEMLIQTEYKTFTNHSKFIFIFRWLISTSVQSAGSLFMKRLVKNHKFWVTKSDYELWGC